MLDRDPARATSSWTSAASSSSRAGLPRGGRATASIRLVDLAEYKRRQAPPGIKVTHAGLRARPADADHQPLRRLSVALVTGCGNPAGLGIAIAGALAERGHAVARHVAPGQAAPEPCFAADLADPDAPAALLERVAAELGPVTVLVNNAAHSTGDGYAALDAATIDAHLAVNVRAPMLLSALVARGGSPGRIVNLVSGQFLGPMPGELAYTASKGALEAFTRQLAGEVAHLAITVNAVGPGPNDTGWIDDALRAELEPKFPGGRVGTPADVAPLVAWLCSDEAAWVTGQVIHAEGGFARQ